MLALLLPDVIDRRFNKKILAYLSMDERDKDPVLRMDSAYEPFAVKTWGCEGGVVGSSHFLRSVLHDHQPPRRGTAREQPRPSAPAPTAAASFTKRFAELRKTGLSTADAMSMARGDFPEHQSGASSSESKFAPVGAEDTGEWDKQADNWDEEADAWELSALACVCTSLRDLVNTLWETRFKGRFLRSAALREIDQRVAEDSSVKVNWRQAFRIVNDSVQCPNKWGCTYLHEAYRNRSLRPKCTAHDNLDVASCKQFGLQLAIITREGNLSVFDCPTGTVTATLECKNTDLHIFAADAKHILVGQPEKTEYSHSYTNGYGNPPELVVQTLILGTTVLTLRDSVTLELVCEFDVQPDKSAPRRLVHEAQMDRGSVLVFFSEDDFACFELWDRNTHGHLEALTAPELHCHESTNLISGMILSTKARFDPETGAMAKVNQGYARVSSAPGGVLASRYWSECFQDSHPGRRNVHKITCTKSFTYSSGYEVASDIFKHGLDTDEQCSMSPGSGGCAWDSTVLFPAHVDRYGDSYRMTHNINVLYPGDDGEHVWDTTHGGVGIGLEWKEGVLWSTSTVITGEGEGRVTCEKAHDIAWHDWMIIATFGREWGDDGGAGFYDEVVCVRVWDLTEACSSQMRLSPVCS
jgi:hypothetical protein